MSLTHRNRLQLLFPPTSCATTTRLTHSQTCYKQIHTDTHTNCNTKQQWPAAPIPPESHPLTLVDLGDLSHLGSDLVQVSLAVQNLVQTHDLYVFCLWLVRSSRVTCAFKQGVAVPKLQSLGYTWKQSRSITFTLIKV